ncbi:MAG: hypothetical protein CMM25_02840 [Rhodospirillaceae bacterium]|nr:hypothetical protein [Rhodospirillaceae bacterium]
MSNLKQDLLLCSLYRFYSDKNHAITFLTILKKKSKVSLRLLDWMATNYSKSKQVSYDVNGKCFNVYASYKSQLKGYSKGYFDPFQRKGRIQFVIQNESIETTVGQLNFFKWAIQNDVIKYALEHCKEIHADMISQTGSENGKRKLLSTNKTISQSSFPIILEF